MASHAGVEAGRSRTGAVLRAARAVLPAGLPMPYPEWAIRHSRLVAVLWAHVPILFVFALVRGRSPAHAVADVTPVAVCALLAARPQLGRRLRTALLPLGLLSASAILVHLSGGTTEMHFHFFVAIALLSLYGEWMPFLLAIGLTVLHHGTLGVLLPGSVYGGNPAAVANPWPWAIIHGLFVLAASAASLGAWRINEHSHARAEAELKRAYELEREMVDKLRELDAAKNSFVSNMSHELRTPLTTILGYLELLGESAPDELGDMQGKAVEVMDRNARRLRALVEDLLIVSGVEARPSPADFTDIEPAGLLAIVCDDIRAKAQAASLDLQVSVDEGLGLVNGECEQLRRALGNLAENAVKFTPPGGQVVLAARRAEGGVRFEVVDSGIGIPMDEQAQLFTRFFRSSLARERHTPGAGLGLAIAKRIVDLHQGQIAVTSDPAVGTTASIVLPVRVPVG
jgi:signal transduction histidine kinase